MIVLDKLTQGSEDWIRERLGVLTASHASEIITPGLKLSAQRHKLVCRLAAERILQEPVDSFEGSYWTERGLDLEGEAGAFFELQTGLVPKSVGFVYRDESRDCGCSPDWLIGAPGNWEAGVEVKCPKAETHVSYLLAGEALRYSPQVQFSLWVTDLAEWWFMSYYPRLPPLLARIDPDPKWQDAFSEHVPEVLVDVASAAEAISAG